MIHKKFCYLLICGLAFIQLLSSCGEDRSGEYYALIKTKTWMYDIMQENYLFYEDIPTEDKLDFFDKPAAFLQSAASDKDQKNGILFSHVDSVFTRTTSAYPCFGMEGVMLRTNGGSTVIRVLYVQPNSPASEAKLKRGDWIIAVNEKEISANDYSIYIERPTQAYRFTLGAYNPKSDDIEEDQDYIEFDTLSTVQMSAPRYVEQENLLKSEIISTSSRKALYLLYNEFGEDIEKLKTALQEAAGQSFDDIILDLRYNPGGYVSTAQLLSTCLAPQSAIGHPFLYMTYNDKLNKTEALNFEQSLLPSGIQLEYQNLYIITSGNTASASEIVINCLKPYMKGRLLQVGSTTFGKNVAQQLFEAETAPGIQLWLTTCYLENAEKFYDYYETGLKPDYTIEENFAMELGDFGTESDQLLKPVFYHMNNGNWPVGTPSKSNSRALKAPILYNTISQKPKLGLLPAAIQTIH